MDDVKILIAVIAGSVTAFGWLVTHILTLWREDIKRSREALLSHTESQLKELYGPLAFLIIEGEQVFRDLLRSLGRNFVFYQDQTLSKEEWETWMFWTESYFLPRNEKIKELLMANTHLIEQERMPESYITFLNHCNSWSINHLRWKEQKIEYSWHSDINWPNEFGEHVLDTFKKLQRRHSLLINKLGYDGYLLTDIKNKNILTNR